MNQIERLQAEIRNLKSCRQEDRRHILHDAAEIGTIKVPRQAAEVHGSGWVKGFYAGVDMYTTELHRAAEGVKDE